MLAFKIARKSFRSLGLEEYEAVFRKNEIDESVLPDITEDHLRELGFSLGDTYT